jgi:hypothetical protein
MKKFQINSKNLANSLLVLSLMAGCAGLFGGSVNAASVTTTVNLSWSSMSDAASFNPAATPATGTISGGLWDEPGHGSPEILDAAVAASFSVPACVTSPSVSISRLLGGSFTGGSATSDAGVAIIDSLYAPVYGFTTPALVPPGPVATVDIPNVPLIAGGSYRVIAGVDTSDGEVWTGTKLPATATVTYDNSSCPVVATDPDISTTPSSTPVTINILGNDTGTNLNVSKIDNQTITSGDTITLTNGSGTVKLNTDGTITFTPNSTFSGESIFSYSITDGASTVDTGVVRITVAATTTTNTTTTTTTPSTPTASTTSTNSTKVLAKTGEDVRLVITVSAAILILGLLAKFKSIKRANSYRV